MRLHFINDRHFEGLLLVAISFISRLIVVQDHRMDKHMQNFMEGKDQK